MFAPFTSSRLRLSVDSDDEASTAPGEQDDVYEEEEVGGACSQASSVSSETDKVRIVTDFLDTPVLGEEGEDLKAKITSLEGKLARKDRELETLAGRQTMHLDLVELRKAEDARAAILEEERKAHVVAAAEFASSTREMFLGQWFGDPGVFQQLEGHHLDFLSRLLDLESTDRLSTTKAVPASGIVSEFKF